MKFSIRSLQCKLLTTGLLSILLPLTIVGIFAVTKSSSGLLHLSEEKAGTMAGDLSRLVKELVRSEVEVAELLANDSAIATNLESLSQRNGEAGTDAPQPLLATLRAKFRNINHAQQYQGLFVTDTSGLIRTGILENGQEYGRISIADNEEFLAAKQQGRAAVGEMIRSQATSQNIVPIVAPILGQNDQFLGVIGMVLKADYFTALVADRKIGKTGYAYMINREGVILAHPKAEHILKLNVTTIKEMAGINKIMISGSSAVTEYVFQGVRKIAGAAPVGIHGWSIAVTQDAAEFLQTSDQIRNIIMMVVLIALAAATVVLLLSTRKIIRPINAAVIGFKDIARGEGDLTMRLPVLTSDEVGDLATWFNLFIEKLQTMIRDITAGVHTLSSSATKLSQISEQMNQGAQRCLRKFGQALKWNFCYH